MTTALLTRFVTQRPFEPFTLVTADGRELHARHPEHVSLGTAAMSVVYIHPTGQLEFLDTDLVVSIRTIYPAEFDVYGEPAEPEGE